MKKYLWGIVLAVVFVIYSLAIRHKNPDQNIVLANNSKSNNSSPNLTQQKSSSPQISSNNSGGYKDGTYTGKLVDAFYGNVQVAISITGGKIDNVKFLSYPNNEETSVMINQQAMPLLQKETIKSQSGNVQIISGATFTSKAYQKSLQDALNNA